MVTGTFGMCWGLGTLDKYERLSSKTSTNSLVLTADGSLVEIYTKWYWVIQANLVYDRALPIRSVQILLSATSICWYDRVRIPNRSSNFVFMESISRRQHHNVGTKWEATSAAVSDKVGTCVFTVMRKDGRGQRLLCCKILHAVRIL